MEEYHRFLAMPCALQAAHSSDRWLDLVQANRQPDMHWHNKPVYQLCVCGLCGTGNSYILSVLYGRTNARAAGSMLFNDQPVNEAIERDMDFAMQQERRAVKISAELRQVQGMATCLKIARWSRSTTTPLFSYAPCRRQANLKAG